MELPATKINYEPVFAIREVASIFKLSPTAVRQLIKKGELASIRIGKQFRIPKSVIDSYFNSYESPVSSQAFGLLKNKKGSGGINFENKIRKKTKHQSLPQFLAELQNL